MKKFRIVLQLSLSDQKELNYQNPNFQFDYTSLMQGLDFITVDSSTKQEILDAIKNKMYIPTGYLDDYSVIVRGDDILVIKE